MIHGSKRLRRTRLAGLVAVVGAALGCGVSGGLVLEITNAMPPQGDDCTFNPTAQVVLGSGVYDPSGQDGYILGLRLVSTVADPDELGFRDDQGDLISPQARLINILGFDMCFYEEDDPGLGVIDRGAGGNIDCGALPAEQQRFVSATGTVPPDGSPIVSIVNILSHQDLQALWGPNFEPFKLPIVGPYFTDSNGNGIFGDPGDDIRYSFRRDDPTWALEPSVPPDPPVRVRSPFWGTFPNDRYFANVIVQLTAVGEMQSGARVQSNEFRFRISIEPGRVDAMCGPLTLIPCATNICGAEQCAQPQTDPAEQRACVVSEPQNCTGYCAAGPQQGLQCFNYAFSGPRAAAVDGCLKYQLGSPLVCNNFDGCLGGGPT